MKSHTAKIQERSALGPLFTAFVKHIEHGDGIKERQTFDVRRVNREDAWLQIEVEQVVMHSKRTDTHVFSMTFDKENAEKFIRACQGLPVSRPVTL